MSWTLLAPLGLAALTAWLLPLLIHLVRRPHWIDTEFAALRWISPRTRPHRRLRFERPWLLALRLLLLALLALLLARLAWLTPATEAPGNWILLAPGVDPGAARERLSTAGEWHWLSEGFPRLDTAPATTANATASLLREFDARVPGEAPLRIVVPETLGELDGERPQLRHAVQWIVVPGSTPEPAPPSPLPITLHVRYAAAESAALRWLRAAVAAWNVREPGRYSLDAQPLTQPLADSAHWLIWLAPDMPPAVQAWIERGGIAVATHRAPPQATPLWHGADGRVLASEQMLGSGRLIALPGALAPQDLPGLAEPEFAGRLLATLHGPGRAPDRAVAQAMVPGRAAAHDGAAIGQDGQTAQVLDTWLALVLAWLFACERWLATRVRREGQA